MRAGEFRDIVDLIGLATGTVMEALPAVKAIFTHFSANGGSATIDELRAVVSDAKATNAEMEAAVKKGRAGQQEPSPKRVN